MSYQSGLRLSHHMLSIENATASLAFYRRQLGMDLVETVERPATNGTESCYFLGITPSHSNAQNPVQPFTLLELHHHYEAGTDPKSAYSHDRQDGYWKIGICLRDVDLARDRLMAAGIEVSQPSQFRDIGYLCHLADPTGFCIELIQHHFAANFRPAPADPDWHLGSAPMLGQITLRIKDPGTSLDFYQNLLGMKLLSRQIVAPYRFTLYFLACTDEEPPVADLDAVTNREWLWQRPYTTLELQHRWGTEESDFNYRLHDDRELGFRGIGFVTRAWPELCRKLTRAGHPITANWDWGLRTETVTIRDPDGYRIRFAENPTSSCPPGHHPL